MLGAPGPAKTGRPSSPPRKAGAGRPRSGPRAGGMEVVCTCAHLPPGLEDPCAQLVQDAGEVALELEAGWTRARPARCRGRPAEAGVAGDLAWTRARGVLLPEPDGERGVIRAHGSRPTRPRRSGPQKVGIVAAALEVIQRSSVGRGGAPVERAGQLEDHEGASGPAVLEVGSELLGDSSASTPVTTRCRPPRGRDTAPETSGRGRGGDHHAADAAATMASVHGGVRRSGRRARACCRAVAPVTSPSGRRAKRTDLAWGHPAGRRSLGGGAPLGNCETTTHTHGFGDVLARTARPARSPVHVISSFTRHPSRAFPY